MKSLKRFTSEIISKLESVYPEARIQLEFSTAFELLVATILSAQCTDDRVNIVTNKLFSLYRTPEEFAKLEQSELEELIFSTGFYRAKAKNIIATAQAIVNQFSGAVPNTIEELTSLPGVGRKTANVILGNVFGVQSVVVDTHVGRLAYRLGITESTNPEKAEYDIMKAFDKSKWTQINHLFISHGRAVCTSRKAKCEECVLVDLCPKRIVRE
jgi:endonuclease-3